MAASEVDVRESQVFGTTFVHIDARGGTRRERGAAIASAVRAYGKPLRKISISYSETYGFNTATYARYQVV